MDGSGRKISLARGTAAITTQTDPCVDKGGSVSKAHTLATKRHFAPPADSNKTWGGRPGQEGSRHSLATRRHYGAPDTRRLLG